MDDQSAPAVRERPGAGQDPEVSAMRNLAVFFTVIGSLLMPGVAAAKPARQYVLKHPKHEDCRMHYVKRTELVKKHKHGRTVKLRETLCVYVAPKKAPAKPTAPTPTTPTPTTPNRTAPVAPA
jgi:hypothetical protein